MSDESDFKYGGLFKKSGFFKSSSKNSWGKRFFIFNRRTMLLQYWSADEERFYKIEGSVRTQPKSSISLLSSTLTVQPGPAERSMFGQKYPIIISNGPAFGKRSLIVAATSPTVRESWIGIIRGALAELNEKQKMEMVQRRKITDPKHPEYKSLDNQHRIMMEKETQLKDLEMKISRALVQVELMKDKDNRLYKLQERLRKAHKQSEDKLYSLTCEEAHPQWRFKFIDTGYDYAVSTMLDTLPLGLYRHTAPAWASYKWHRPKSKGMIKPEEQPPLIHRRLYRIHEKLSNKKHRMRYLEDSQYYPYNTDNMIVDNIDKQFDDSVVLKKTLGGRYEIRELDDTEDPDMLSLREMDVFKLLKKESTKHAYHLLKRLDREDTNDEEDNTEYDHQQRIEELEFESRRPSLVMGYLQTAATLLHSDEVPHDVAQYQDEYLGHIKEYETRDKVYIVDGKGRKF